MYRRLALLALLPLGACGDPLEPAPVDRACTPQYQPTFDNVFANTLMPNCAVSGCHSEAQARGGFNAEEIEHAYDELVGDGRVIPGDPENSEMIMRVFSKSSEWQMPPPGEDEEPLSEAEKCALALWVLEGAER
jgi:hypothetical protein